MRAREVWLIDKIDGILREREMRWTYSRGQLLQRDGRNRCSGVYEYRSIRVDSSQHGTSKQK